MPVEEMKPVNENDPAFVALHKELRERAAELGERRGLPEEVVHQVLDAVTEPGRFADLVAGYIELPPPEKQGLLETLSVEERLRRVLVHVQRQIGMLEAQEEIKSQVQEELGRAPARDVPARADEGDPEGARRRRPVEGDRASCARSSTSSSCPRRRAQEVERELGRLERSGRESMEAQVIRTYLEWIAELPWNTRSDDNLDLTHAQTVLDEDHYGLPDVKDRVLEFLAVRQLRAQQLADELKQTGEMSDRQAQGDEGRRDAVSSPSVRRRRPARSPTRRKRRPARWRRARSSCSSARRASARRRSPSRSRASLGREYVRVSLGGARDEADIRGHRRTYVGAMPGRIIQGMKQAGTKNPVFLLDEVDKLGVSFQGDPASALLEVLDPAQNDTFTDHYLGVPFDLSEVLFIATANFIQNIPGPLLDRMEVVEFAGYTEREKAEIAKKYLIPRQLEESGLARQERRVHRRRGRRRSISKYTRESGRSPARAADRRGGAEGRAEDRRRRDDDDRRRQDRRRGSARAARPSEGPPGACGRGERGRRRHRHVLHARRAATSCSSRRRFAACSAAASARPTTSARR